MQQFIACRLDDRQSTFGFHATNGRSAITSVRMQYTSLHAPRSVKTLTFKDRRRMDHFRSVLKYIFAAGTIAVIVLSLLPGKYVPSVGLSDKLEHVLAYAFLGLTGGLAFPTSRAAVVLLMLLPLLGIALEIGQLVVPGRSSEVADAFANLMGAALALLPILVVRLSSTKMR
jgi:VanZ family protein